MMGRQSGQMSMIILDLSELIPENHLLRKINQMISFDFIYDLVAPYYLRSLFAVGFQGLLILVCVAIYAVLIQGIATGGDPIGAIWGTVGYTVLLCFMLFKTGTIARSIFNAH